MNKHDIQYLLGGWFEEYIYYIIRNNSFSCENVMTSVEIENKHSTNVPNEIDVMLVKGTVPVIIECKTAMTTGILHNTIYKQAALRKNFGLQVTSIIVTLSSDLQQESKDRGEVFDIKIFESIGTEASKQEFLDYIRKL